MTPEERQRTMDFILETQANSAVRMAQHAEDLARLEQDRIQTLKGLSQVTEEQKRQKDEQRRQKDEQKREKERIDALLRVTHDLVKVSANVVDRTKRLETRSDSFDEMIKVLRELLEANLRRPDNPRPENS